MTKLNKTATRARDVARRRHRMDLLACFITAVMLGIFFGQRSVPNELELPPEMEIVVAHTSDGSHMAYLDTDGEFKSMEDGMPIGQVIRWSDQ